MLMNTSLMELDFSRADVLRLLDLCSRDDDRTPDCRPLLARIHNVRPPYDYLALSGLVHDILKRDVFLSNYCLFRGWFSCWKVIVESDPLRALTASDRDRRSPLHHACAIDDRSLAIVRLVLSTGGFDPDAVSPGGDGSLPWAILCSRMDVVDAFLASSPDRVPLMKSARKILQAASLSCRRELTGRLLKLVLDASFPLNAIESVREAILRSLECTET
jgi:hypothetical protein